MISVTKGNLHAFLKSNLLLLILHFTIPHGGGSPERDSLLQFRSKLTFSSNYTTLSSWLNIDDCCKWEGISCDLNGFVSSLSLPAKGLGGSFSNSLAGLTHLTLLNLSSNYLTGNLPDVFLRSPSLVVLDISFNRFSGELPAPLHRGSLYPLQVLNLSSNSFTGPFPALSINLSFLKEVNISKNNFFGSLPSSLCRLSPSLLTLDLSYNQFNGEIPVGLGHCSVLTEFKAGNNNLSGPITNDLLNITSLRLLSLPFNQLSGIINGTLIPNLFNLIILDLSSNQLSGNLPASISQIPSLEQLILYENQLSGALPLEVANCTKLKVLNLRFNNLSGKLSAIDFSRLSSLSMLDLMNNNFSGDIPPSLYSLKSIKALRLARNSLNGEIAPAMGNLQALSYLSLSGNGLKNIRNSFQILKQCKNISAILLSKNFIGEAMPMTGDWGGTYFQNLEALGLGGSMLTGQVPLWLASLSSLMALDLSNNRLTGPVPTWLGSLPRLFYLDLTGNLLSGEIPPEITGLPALLTDQFEYRIDSGFLEIPVIMKVKNNSGLQYNQLTDLPPAIYLRNNSLNGMILPQIGRLRNLHSLDLSYNNFSGRIPPELSNLTNLEKLDISSNNLDGMIPPTMIRLHFLAFFNVANNNLQGPVPSGGQFDSFPPSSYEGNPRLCGPILLKHCSNKSKIDDYIPSTKHLNKKTLIGTALGVSFGGAFVLVISGFIILKLKKARERKCKFNATSSVSSVASIPPGDPLLVMVPNPGDPSIKNLSLSDIIKATNNFSQQNVIGSGGFGLVFKATLPDGSKLAIKRLSGEMCLMEREFRAEVEALSKARNENLVTLEGYCIHGSSCLLIYSFMENGCLDYWLHENVDEAFMLDWSTRLKIAQGISRGIYYIHETCQPHIVHRDIKSSNILLDDHFEAHVADFGLSRLILPCNTHVSTEMVGTLGYIPPEYGQSSVATVRGDMYSFGVVLLELLTRRRPVEVFHRKGGAGLVVWAKLMNQQGEQDQIFDSQLKGKGSEEQMAKVLDIACMCLNDNPLKRPTIGEVVAWLKCVGNDERT